MILHFIWLLFRRSYTFLFLTFCSLVIGGFLFGTVFSFTKSASTYLLEQGKVLTGGDIVLSSPYPIDLSAPVLKNLHDEGHILSTGEDLQAVFTSGTSSSTAASTLRLVSTAFPLYGNVILEDGSQFVMTPGTIYAEKAFLDKIGVQPGGIVVLGGAKFKVKGVLIKEPDTISLGISFTPKVIMSLDDFGTLSKLFSQSRINYKVTIKENPLRVFTTDEKKSLETYARQNKVRFDDATNGPNNLIRGLSSVSKFIGIVLSVTLFLVVINIGANLVYVLTRFRKAIALLKIHGATNRQIQIIYTVLLTIVGFVAGALGALVGVVATTYGISFVDKLLDVTLPATNVLYVVLLGGVFGAVFIIISALPFLQALTKIQPKELLMNQTHTNQKFSLVSILVYFPVPLLLSAILYAVTKDIWLSAISVATCIGLFLMFMALSYGLIAYLYKVRNSFSFILQSIVSYLYIRSMRTSITTASIMTAFCGVFIVIAVQNNITYNLQRNVATTAPSLYLVDMTKSEREGVKKNVGPTYMEYPIVRGRLVTLNGKNISELNDQELRREFNMTYRDTLINGEKVIAGTFGDTANVKNPVSIDKAFADDLGGAKLGDTLTVFIQGITIPATITSIREVDSRSGIPFFYLVFPPSVLESFPASYFATANVTGDDVKTIEDAIGSEFPNIIPVATGLIVATVASLLQTAITVVSVVGFPSIALGLLLILVMLWQSLYERSGDVLVMRAFGLERKRVTQLFIIETGLLSAVSGIIAYLVAHLVAYILNIYIFSFTLFTFAIIPLYIIIGNVVLVCVLSYFLSYRLTNSSLKKLLSEK